MAGVIEKAVGAPGTVLIVDREGRSLHFVTSGVDRGERNEIRA